MTPLVLAPSEFWSRRPVPGTGPARVRSRAMVVAMIAGVVVVLVLSIAPLGGVGSPPPLSNVRSGAATHPSVAGVRVPASPAPNCAGLSTGWSLLDTLHPAPDVAAYLQGPCSVGHDVPGLYFLSNANGSGERFQMLLGLPANTTSPASAFAAFWVGLWVAGVPCSYGGASYLTVELIPPYSSAAGVPPGPNWSVSAPVWDLVPPGSCDPQCQNDTAFVTIQGRSYCEDDAMLTGVGALNGTVSGRFSPGDRLSLAIVGTAGSSVPLAVYVNDSTNPSRSLTWNYSAGTSYRPGGPMPTGTVSGRPLTPLYATASADHRGWTGGLDVGFGWQNCPLPSTHPFVSACNSYDGPVVQVAGTPEVQVVTSWNSTTHSYANPYPSMVTVSSSGACSGLAGVSPCQGFSTNGGTGAYPTYSLDAAMGRAWLAYGAPGPQVVSDLGGLSAQFPAQGNLSSPVGSTVVSNLRTSVGSSAVTLTARVSDLYGVTQVRMSDWWCPSSGPRIPVTVPATLNSGGFNTALDGNWSVNFPTNGHVGSLYFGVVAHSYTGVDSAPANGNVTVTGVGTNCVQSPPSAPTLTPTNITPIGGGYTLKWNESLSQGVIAYQVAAVNGSSSTFFPEGNVTSATVTGLAGHAAYTLRVTAINRANQGATSFPVAAPNTYAPLATLPLNITGSAGWVNATTAMIVANVTGGLPPFTFAFDFGDGTTASVFTVGGGASTSHLFARNFSGVAAIQTEVKDSIGDSVDVPTGYALVVATPLATPASLSAGDGFVEARWTPPLAPPGLTVLGYTVYWTTDPASAPYLTAAWPTNASLPAVHVAVTTAALQSSIPVPIGTKVFAQVVAWDKYGEGWLPPEPALGAEPVLSVVDAGFASSGITVLPAGGTAPLTANFSAEFTTGPGTTVVNATYHFTGGSAVVAPITGGNGRFWANVSVVFNTPGARTVYLYAVDSLSELLLLTTGLYVAPSTGPVVAVSVNPTPVFVSVPVELSAAPTGGSGSYAYSWDLGGGNHANGSAVNSTYTTPGTYLVSVTVTDSVYGGSTTARVAVTVYGPPTVAIGIVPTSAAGTYALAAFATGQYLGPLSFTWIFGDGAQASGVNVSHRWAQPGTYTIDVRVTDGAGHTTVAATNLTVVYPAPPTATSSNAFPPVAVGLLIAVLALAAAVGVLLVHQRRARSRPHSESEDTNYAGEAPPPSYEEEQTPRMR